jgi:hypothetical protein
VKIENIRPKMILQATLINGACIRVKVLKIKDRTPPKISCEVLEIISCGDLYEGGIRLIGKNMDFGIRSLSEIKIDELP